VAFPSSSIDPPSKMLCLTVIADGLISFTTDHAGVRSVQVLDLPSGGVSRPNVLNSPSDRSCPLVPALSTDPWIIFVSNRAGPDEIFKYDIDTKSETQLTFGSAWSLGPSRSSSEDSIAFYSKQTGNWDIYVLGLDGNNEWNITNNPADDIQPAWEPY
jgi:Tol biopolymer transport system component